MLILAVTIVVSLATAYLALWGGLGGHRFLSSANTWFALRVGVAFGFVVSIALNCLSVRHIKNHAVTVLIVMTAMQTVFGASFMLWVAIAAAC